MTPETRRTLCVVPARGGSRRVPRKNARPIDGIPMVQRTLDTVLTSRVASRIIVSTDDSEIAELARTAGAEVPFVRPAKLADDQTATAPVIAHAISAVESLDETYEFVLVVYPTAVLIAAADLRAGRDAVVGSDHELAFSVCRFSAPIERAWRRGSDGTGEMLQPQHALTRTQDLETAFYDAGQFYFGTSRFWRAGGDVASARPVLIELPHLRSVDIDTEDDFDRAERLLVLDRMARTKEPDREPGA